MISYISSLSFWYRKEFWQAAKGEIYHQVSHLMECLHQIPLPRLQGHHPNPSIHTHISSPEEETIRVWELTRMENRKIGSPSESTDYSSYESTETKAIYILVQVLWVSMLSIQCLYKNIEYVNEWVDEYSVFFGMFPFCWVVMSNFYVMFFVLSYLFSYFVFS